MSIFYNRLGSELDVVFVSLIQMHYLWNSKVVVVCVCLVSAAFYTVALAVKLGVL